MLHLSVALGCISPCLFLGVVAGHESEHCPNSSVGFGSKGDDSRAKSLVDVPPVVVAGEAGDGVVDDVHAFIDHVDGLWREALLSYL